MDYFKMFDPNVEFWAMIHTSKFKNGIIEDYNLPTKTTEKAHYKILLS
jgi:hypothetical protein